MGGIKNYFWLIPLIGGSFSIIGLLFPAWYSPPVWIEYVWIIGIIHHVTGGNIFDNAPSEMFIPSIIATGLITLCSVVIIIIALLKFRGKTLSGNTENLWIILAIIEIGTSIYYIFMIQNGFFQNTGLIFWDIYEFQFGMFIPFISASLTLFGALIGKLIKEEINEIR